jgi:hypothetical protein
MDTMDIMDTNEPLERHPLHSEWVVWYHNPSDQTWTQESYKDILELASIEDFLVLKNSWNQCLPLVHEGMFFMMRKKDGRAIMPLWEDQENREGGVWSFKIDKDDAERIWFMLCMHMIGETICDDVNLSMDINGISISPKKNFCIVKIWNKTCINSQVDIISRDLTFLDLSGVLYTNHTNNLEREQQKIKFNNQFGGQRWDGVRGERTGRSAEHRGNGERGNGDRDRERYGGNRYGDRGNGERGYGDRSGGYGDRDRRDRSDRGSGYGDRERNYDNSRGRRTFEGPPEQ